jgi:hypothetical protein
MIGRSVMKPDEILKIVAPPGSPGKQLKAYNLCDGTRTQGQIIKELHLDSGNFSRKVTRWIGAGVLYSIESEGERQLLHVYPINQGSDVLSSRIRSKADKPKGSRRRRTGS